MLARNLRREIVPAGVMEQIEIDRETIGHALRDSKLYVPIHQRPYSWEAEHVTDLYQDLAGAIKDGSPEYFLGSIVIVRGQDGQLEVNDGQQRLATSMILLAAIRDYFLRSNDTKTAEVIESQFLFSTDRRTLDVEPKLTLNTQDHDFFVKRVLRRPDAADRKAIKPSKDSHRRIQQAATFAGKHVAAIIAQYGEKDRADELHRWVDYLEKGARIIRVTVADDRTAYIIFETMNDRGLQLSASDLLKNRLYGMAGDRIGEVMERWQRMSGALEALPQQEETLLLYIRHLWVSLHGTVRSRFLYDRIRESVISRQTAIDLSTELELNAPRYAALLNPSHDLWTEYGASARKHIATLSVLGGKSLRPLLLSTLDKFSKPEVNRLLHSCVCWSVRCLMAGVGGGALESSYNEASVKVRSGAIKDTEAVTQAMLSIIPDDARFKAAAGTLRVSDGPLARYYLRVLQQQADGQREPEYVPNDDPTITLEHILPENPGAGWEHMTAEERALNWNRLGNLALLQATPNSKLGNRPFHEKAPELLKSSFSLTKLAGEFTAWSPKEIQTRQEKLAELGLSAWPLRPK
jgi:hypothetical protein